MRKLLNKMAIEGRFFGDGILAGERSMLTDTALRNLKAKATAYKVADRDGMYVHVAASGSITFRYDYRLNSRRETLTIGKYGPDGLSLARAREKCVEARRLVAEGQSPA